MEKIEAPLIICCQAELEQNLAPPKPKRECDEEDLMLATADGGIVHAGGFAIV